MYQFAISNAATQSLKTGSIQDLNRKKRIMLDIESMQENPYKRAKETGKPMVGQYYMNCGSRFCIIFDIHEHSKTVHILKVIKSAALHKILAGRIKPENYFN